MGNGKAVGNFAMSDTVSTRAADRTDAKATLQAVCRQTKRFKETGAPFADLVSRSAGWPSWLARRMPWMFGGSGVDGPGDCGVLSNLGRGDYALESFGSDLPITGLWFTTGCISDRGRSWGRFPRRFGSDHDEVPLAPTGRCSSHPIARP